jgi:hypothetical protein
MEFILGTSIRRSIGHFSTTMRGKHIYMRVMLLPRDLGDRLPDSSWTIVKTTTTVSTHFTDYGSPSSCKMDRDGGTFSPKLANVEVIRD